MPSSLDITPRQQILGKSLEAYKRWRHPLFIAAQDTSSLQKYHINSLFKCCGTLFGVEQIMVHMYDLYALQKLFLLRLTQQPFFANTQKRHWRKVGVRFCYEINLLVRIGYQQAVFFVTSLAVGGRHTLTDDQFSLLWINAKPLLFPAGSANSVNFIGATFSSLSFLCISRALCGVELNGAASKGLKTIICTTIVIVLRQPPHIVLYRLRILK